MPGEDDRNKKRVIKNYLDKYHANPEIRKKAIIRSLTRQQMRKEDKCARCDSKENLQFHHNTYSVRDVITLCHKCHVSEHYN